MAPLDVYGHVLDPAQPRRHLRCLLLGGRPKVRFDAYDGERHIQDEEGLHLDSPDKAKVQAIRALADMARSAVPEEDRREVVVEIRDETGRKFWRARLTLVVEVPSNQ